MSGLTKCSSVRNMLQSKNQNLCILIVPSFPGNLVKKKFDFCVTDGLCF